MSMSRHELREQTFKMLFGAEFHDGEDKREALENYIDVTIERELTPEERQAAAMAEIESQSDDSEEIEIPRRGSYSNVHV